MNNNKEQFDKAIIGLRQITLDEKKKSEIRETLMNHIKGNPGTSPSPYSSTFFLKRYKIAIISLFAVSFGTAFASTPSLPGEFLYPVKTQIVEPIIKFAKLTPEAEVKYEAELANTRIAEMQELKIKNRVTEENTRQNQELFSANIAAIETFKSTRPEKRSIVDDVIDLSGTVNLYNNIVLATSSNESYTLMNISTTSTGTTTTVKSGFKNVSKVKVAVPAVKNVVNTASANVNVSTTTNINHVVNEVINNIPGVNISNHSTSSVQSTTTINTTNSSASTHINEVIQNTVNSVIKTGGIFK